MGPLLTTSQRAQQLFSDPAVRAQVRGWHDQGVSFLDMIDRLGFSDTVDDGLRAAIAGLTPAEVAIIREVFIAEIDRAGAGTVAPMPVSCSLPAVTGPVLVSAGADDKGKPVAVVAAQKGA